MIIPSIDIMNGQAVQLIGGETHALDAGDPLAIGERFSRVGPIAVIDLDAALGQGDNTEIIEALCRRYRCRVGGGIRSIARAKAWLDAGAEQIIIGTRATPEFLAELPESAASLPWTRAMTRSWSRAGRHRRRRIESRMAALKSVRRGLLGHLRGV